jgi:hypothetical protein
LLVADVLGLAAWRRLVSANASAHASLVLGMQLVVAVCAIASFVLDDVAFNGWLFWGMLILLSAALGAVAMRVGRRGLARAGGVATAIAVALVLAHSFLSVAAAGVATVLCLGAALLPSGRTEASVPAGGLGGSSS